MMKKRILSSGKRLLSVAVVLAMTFSLAACGSNGDKDSKNAGVTSNSAKEESKGQSAEASYFNKTGYPICNEPIDISVSGYSFNTPDWNETDQVKEILKRFNIKMNCTTYELDAWKTQFTLMLAEDTLPDLLLNASNITASEVANYGADNYFLPINDYLEYMPNLSVLLEKDENFRKSITSPDGKIYGLATYASNDLSLVTRAWINKKWLDNVGMDYPETAEELYQVLKAFKEKDANGNGDPDDEIPMSWVTGEPGIWLERSLMSTFGINSNTNNLMLQVDDNGKIYLSDSTENYKAYLEYMNKLYSEGLLDPESFVQTLDEFNAKAADDKIGVFGGAAPFVVASKSIDYDANFMWLTGLTSDYNKVKSVNMTNQTGVMKVFISAKAKYPEAICRLLDYYYGENTWIDGSRGFEGVTYENEDVLGVEGQGYKTAAVVIPDALKDQYSSEEEYRYKKGVINNGFVLMSGTKNTQYGAVKEVDDASLEKMKTFYGWCVLIEQRLRNGGAEKVSVYPNLTYSEDQVSIRTALSTDITSYLTTVKTQFITNEMKIDKDWDSFIGTVDKMGLKDLLEIEQKAYDSFSK